MYDRIHDAAIRLSRAKATSAEAKTAAEELETMQLPGLVFDVVRGAATVANADLRAPAFGIGVLLHQGSPIHGTGFLRLRTMLAETDKEMIAAIISVSASIGGCTADEFDSLDSSRAYLFSPKSSYFPHGIDLLFYADQHSYCFGETLAVSVTRITMDPSARGMVNRTDSNNKHISFNCYLTSRSPKEKHLAVNAVPLMIRSSGEALTRSLSGDEVCAVFVINRAAEAHLS